MDQQPNKKGLSRFSKKERELSQEEALKLAKEELAPRWFFSEPLIAGVKNGKMISVFPLNEKFTQYTWIICFVNATSVDLLGATIFLKEWKKRYLNLSMKTIFVVDPTYRYMAEKAFFKKLNETLSIESPMVLDTDRMLEEAFRVESKPSILLFSEGKVLSQAHGLREFTVLEKFIQSFLRKKSPGLPLEPPFLPKEQIWTEEHVWDLGNRSQIKFIQSQGEEELEENSVLAIGDWKRDDEGITTQDPDAQLKFILPSPSLSLVATKAPLPKPIPDPSKIVIEVNSRSLVDEFRSAEIKIDDQGSTYIELQEPRVYPMAMRLPENLREITLRFPYAKRLPVCLYSLKMAVPMKDFA